jgi:hypothetical protein
VARNRSALVGGGTILVLILASARVGGLGGFFMFNLI